MLRSAIPILCSAERRAATSCFLPKCLVRPKSCYTLAAKETHKQFEMDSQVRTGDNGVLLVSDDLRRPPGRLENVLLNRSRLFRKANHMLPNLTKATCAQADVDKLLSVRESFCDCPEFDLIELSVLPTVRWR